MLDLHGKMIDSETFAKNLDTWQMKHSNIVFVIAGSLGPSEKLVSRANYRWKIIGSNFYTFNDASLDVGADLSWF